MRRILTGLPTKAVDKSAPRRIKVYTHSFCLNSTTWSLAYGPAVVRQTEHRRVQKEIVHPCDKDVCLVRRDRDVEIDARRPDQRSVARSEDAVT